MNFGVSLSLKKHLDSLLNGNDGHIKDEDEFFALNLKEILIIHKYLDTAVQKLNGKYIKRELADINPNLLSDFIEGPKKSTVKEKHHIDYRDAIKNSINLDNKEDFPELEKIAREEPAKPNAWKPVYAAKPKRKSKVKPKPKPRPREHYEVSNNMDEEFPPLPATAAKPVNVEQSPPELPQVIEVKKTFDEKDGPLTEYVKVKDEQKGQVKGKDKKERKRNKQGKGTTKIQFGFH
eukprot:TRINITY_DN77_c0_g1_i9.p1 TRINITY_DN77_c0_g1~~TRINITY_DN77_c0_g1_i9.p1  ORF type:complete len:235 (-),score=69.99 TRINITY_DN77_c0_g1_i9:115-819(-)